MAGQRLLIRSLSTPCGFWDQTQVIKLSDRHFYMINHLAKNPLAKIFLITFFIKNKIIAKMIALIFNSRGNIFKNKTF